MKNNISIKELEQLSKPDSHGVTLCTTECVCITIPISGWYKLNNSDKEVYFTAGDQLIVNGPFLENNPKSLSVRNKT